MNRYTKFIPPTAALAACIAMSACVTAPPDNPLPQARAAVQTAQADPAVARYDAVDLAAAQRHLINAENANEHQERDVTDQEASLAIRTARLSQTRADEIVAQGGISAADSERAKEAAAAAYANSAPVYPAVDDESAAAVVAARDLQTQITGLSVQPSPQGSMLLLTDNYFDPGRAELKPGADRVLDELAQYLMLHPERRVRVVGHSAETTSAAFNLELSLHRAEAVRTGLIARGVDPVRSEAVGYGPDNPVVASNTGDRLYMRGVEILVSDNRGQIASR